MTRPAQPGDRCFCVRDTEHDGKNLGKTCVVLRQCTCFSSDWKVETLEPWNAYLYLGGQRSQLGRCPAGTELCLCKTDIRPIDDPDLKEPEDVSHPAQTDDRHVH